MNGQSGGRRGGRQCSPFANQPDLSGISTQQQSNSNATPAQVTSAKQGANNKSNFSRNFFFQPASMGEGRRGYSSMLAERLILEAAGIPPHPIPFCWSKRLQEKCQRKRCCALTLFFVIILSPECQADFYFEKHSQLNWALGWNIFFCASTALKY